MARTVDLLKWSVGVPFTDRPPPTDVPLDVLLSDLTYHGVQGRFLTRAAKEQPDWLPAEWEDAVAAKHAAVVRRVHRQLETVTALAACVAEPPVLLKGATAWALTGRDDVLRFSNDVDLLPEDAEAIVAAALAQRFEREPHLAEHEVGGFQKGDVHIDVQRHVPVYRYPAVPADALTPARNGGIWHHAHDFETRVLRYADVAQATLADDRAGRITTATLATLIACAHVFSSLHISGSFPKVRLGELADIRDLSALPSFSRDTFMRLVAEHDAHDAVAATAAIMRDVGQPWALEPGELRDDLPRDLWWAGGRGGFVVSAPDVFDVDDTLLRTVDMTGLVRALGSTGARRTGNPRAYDIDTAASGRVLVRGHRDRPLPALRVERTETGVRVDARMPPPHDDVSFLLNLGWLTAECAFDVAHREVHLHGQMRLRRLQLSDVLWTCENTGDDLALSITVPWTLFAEADKRASADLSLLAGIRLPAQGGEADAALVPITIPEEPPTTTRAAAPTS